MMRFQETLRRLAMIDEGFVEDEAGFGLDPGHGIGPGPQDRGAVSGSGIGGHRFTGVCLEWSVGRALAAGAFEYENADVLLEIAPAAGLGRVVCAAPDVAAALGYDVAAALEEPDDHQGSSVGHVNCGGSAQEHPPEAVDERP